MITGSLTLNGLDDEDMQLIFEMRAKTPLLFNPSGTTIRTKPGVAAKPGHIQAYNNVVMGWTEGSGLAAMLEILKRLNEAHPPDVICRAARRANVFRSTADNGRSLAALAPLPALGIRATAYAGHATP